MNREEGRGKKGEGNSVHFFLSLLFHTHMKFCVTIFHHTVSYIYVDIYTCTVCSINNTYNIGGKISTSSFNHTHRVLLAGIRTGWWRTFLYAPLRGDHPGLWDTTLFSVVPFHLRPFVFLTRSLPDYAANRAYKV